jgi:hypothetical protein
MTHRGTHRDPNRETKKLLTRATKLQGLGFSAYIVQGARGFAVIGASGDESVDEIIFDHAKPLLPTDANLVWVANLDDPNHPHCVSAASIMCFSCRDIPCEYVVIATKVFEALPATAQRVRPPIRRPRPAPNQNAKSTGGLTSL